MSQIRNSKPPQQEYGSALVGKSQHIVEVRKLIKRIAPLTSAVLISGERGTGKKHVARALHYESHRQLGFVHIVCSSSTSNDEIGLDLFGYAKGDFTGAKKPRVGKLSLSHRTIFFEEINTLPHRAQIALRNHLSSENMEGDDTPRIICSTTKSLVLGLNLQQFDQGLFHRINTFEIELQPLRERTEDIPMLVRHFLDIINKRKGTNTTITEEALMKICDGVDSLKENIRSLRNLVERAVPFTEGEIQENDIVFFNKRDTLSSDEERLIELIKRIAFEVDLGFAYDFRLKLSELLEGEEKAFVLDMLGRAQEKPDIKKVVWQARIELVKEMLDQGMEIAYMSEMLGCSPGTVRYVIKKMKDQQKS